ncbi:MAG TPA: hypothetical protein VF556_03170 [Pyrinomonadaceae bacterium]
MKSILTIALAALFCACASQPKQEVKPAAEKEQQVKVIPVAPGTEDKEPGAAPKPAESPGVKKGTISKVVRKGDQVSYQHTVTNEQGLIIVSSLIADCKTNHYKVVYRTVASGNTVVKKDDTVIENNNPNEDAIRDIQSACTQRQQI